MGRQLGQPKEGDTRQSQKATHGKDGRSVSHGQSVSGETYTQFLLTLVPGMLLLKLRNGRV